MSTSNSLRRIPEQGVIAGVLAGIAHKMDWDVTWVRVGFILLSIFSAAFPGLLVYIVLWIAMPKA